jgi:hypothetical protein
MFDFNENLIKIVKGVLIMEEINYIDLSHKKILVFSYSEKDIINPHVKIIGDAKVHILVYYQLPAFILIDSECTNKGGFSRLDLLIQIQKLLSDLFTNLKHDMILGISLDTIMIEDLSYDSREKKLWVSICNENEVSDF